MSAPHPLASLLEARPHIFRSGRGRTRGQWSTSRGNQGVGPRLALPAAAPEPGLAPQVKSRTPAGSPHRRFSIHSFIQQTLPPTCSVPGSVLGAGVLASRELCSRGEVDITQIIPKTGYNRRQTYHLVPSQC